MSESHVDKLDIDSLLTELRSKRITAAEEMAGALVEIHKRSCPVNTGKLRDETTRTVWPEGVKVYCPTDRIAAVNDLAKNHGVHTIFSKLPVGWLDQARQILASVFKGVSVTVRRKRIK